jgi:hypothetical protein
MEGIEALNAVPTSMAAHDKAKKTMSTGDLKGKRTKPPKKTGGKRKKMQEVVQKDTSLPVEALQNRNPVAPAMTTCKYGYSHGGLLELLQLTTNGTKHYLTSGKYMHQKCCTDCNTLIDTLFAESKSRALFYYCQVDYNVSELAYDNREMTAVACSCILCITCYFK